jgi:hypothetical protein
VLHSLRWGGSASALSAVIYDKTKEISEQSTHKQYLLDHYRRAGWDGHQPVNRLEFRFNRDELRRLGIDIPPDVDQAALLRFGMDWLSLRDYPPRGNKQHTRWPISPVWVDIFIQGAALLGDVGVVYERHERHETDIEVLAVGVGGRIASIAALLGTDDPDKAIEVFKRVYFASLERRERTFDGELAKRRDRYMLPAPAQVNSG